MMQARGPEALYVEPSMELLAELGWTRVDAFFEVLGNCRRHARP